MGEGLKTVCFAFSHSFQVKPPKKRFGPFCGKTLLAKIETQASVNITSITDISGAHTGWKMKLHSNRWVGDLCLVLKSKLFPELHSGKA